MKNADQDLKKAPDFDEIVFEVRNKEYGAYVLRRNYRRNVVISLAMAVLIMSALIIIPFLNARAMDNQNKRPDRPVEIIMTAIDQPVEKVAPPPTPPAPPEDVVQQSRYIPPVVVDTVKPEEEQFITADEAEVIVQNTDVMDVPTAVHEEVKDAEPVVEPFIVVEEMPEFPGGLPALMKYVGENLRYPDVPMENNVEGKVTIKFCVTAKGGIDQISVLKSVDPELDKEAMRVVSTLPAFKPGKQGGKPVPVWFMLPIAFKINRQ